MASRRVVVAQTHAKLANFERSKTGALAHAKIVTCLQTWPALASFGQLWSALVSLANFNESLVVLSFAEAHPASNKMPFGGILEAVYGDKVCFAQAHRVRNRQSETSDGRA